MRFATIGEITLHHRLEGSPEGVPLVFINSLGTDLRIWDQVVARFADRFLIIRYDKRGHGLSDCPPGPYTLRDHTNDLTGLLEVLQVKEAVVIGVSVGGMIALDYAACHPDRVKALVLCDTATTIGSAEGWNERIEAIREKGMALVGKTILPRWFAAEFLRQQPAEGQGYYNMLTRTPAEGYIATCEAIREADLSERVGRVTAPALVVGGAEDLVTPPQRVRELAERLPQARFELIKQAGHLPSIEQPEVLAAKIHQFLQENGYG